ncbi:MAG: PAS domain S-box protein [Spirochaetales bacterium]|nr:PAS domain S-box protein [Spirochaetales bacterium]
MEVDEHRVYTWANRAGLNFFGDDVIGREAADFFIGEQKTYEKVQPLFSGNEDVIYLESWQRRRDGAVRLLAWWCKVLKDKAGKMTGALSSARDITDERRAQELVRESEARFRAIFDNGGEGIILADENMKLVMVNKTICAMLGYSCDELSGLSVADIHPPEMKDEVALKFRSLLRGDVKVATDLHVRRKDGTVFCVDIHASPFLLKDVRYLAGFFLDVSDRHRMIEALKESEAHFRAVVEATPRGMHFYRVDETGEAVFAGYNPAADRILGIDHRPLVGKTITAAFPSLAGTGIPERYAEIARRGGVWHDEQVEYRDERIAGAYDVHAFRIRPGYMAASFADITERLRLDADLKTQRELTERIMATSPVCIVTVDRDGRITFANDAAEKLFGLSKSEIVSRRFNDPAWKITDMEGRPIPAERLPFRLVLDTGSPVTAFQHALEGPDGTRVFLSISGSPLYDAEGDISGVVFAIDDVTARITAEAVRRGLEEQVLQAQKMESIGRLAGGVAHDLNNLLTPIIGYADYCLTAKTREANELEQIFKGILDAADRAKTLTQQLLAFSRKQPLAMSVLNLNDVITSILSLLKRTLREDIRVRTALDPELSNIRADRSQIDQIILNLAANAQDALTAGGEIAVATFNAVLEEAAPAFPAALAFSSNALPPGAYAVLSLADDGEGMNQETMRHIFEPFFTTKEKGVGVGLGLATVYGIVTQHGGQIRVASEPGRGTTFAVFFPAVQAGAESAPVPTAQQAALSSGRILLVEDNEDVRVMTEKILSSLGFDVVPAADGRRALELASRCGDIALVVTDVIMPDMNGVSLVETIKRDRPGIKALFMSGYADDIIASRGLNRQDAPLLMKPFTVRQLKDKIAQVLGS